MSIYNKDKMKYFIWMIFVLSLITTALGFYKSTITLKSSSHKKEQQATQQALFYIDLLDEWVSDVKHELASLKPHEDASTHIKSMLKKKLTENPMVNKSSFIAHQVYLDNACDFEALERFVVSSNGGCRLNVDKHFIIGEWFSFIDDGYIYFLYGVSPADVRPYFLGFSVKITDVVGLFYDYDNSSVYHLFIDSKGDLAYHPRSDYINNDIRDLRVFDPVLGVVESEGVTSMKFLSVVDTEQSLWIYNSHADAYPWRIVTVIEILEDGSTLKTKRRAYLQLILSSLILLVSYSMMILRMASRDYYAYWRFVIVFSSVSVVTIAMIWFFQSHMPHPPEEGEHMVLDKTGLSHVVAMKRHQYTSQQNPMLHKNIPTLPVGIRIDGIELVDSNTVSIIGLTWIKKSSNVKFDDVKLEFRGAKSFTLDPYQENKQSISWRFITEIELPLDTSLYPFERGYLSVRIATEGYSNDYQLIPDIDAYTIMSPNSKPGLSDFLVMSGWDIFRSYFSYKKIFNAENYSNGDPLYDGVLFELNYNIEVGRKFISPFVSDIVPIIVVTVLLFLVVMTMTKGEQGVLELGFNASTMLSYCSGLFFVLIVSHVYLREKLSIENIAYVELYYFMMYFLILSISASAIMFSSVFPNRLMDYNDGIIIKLSFWPLLFLIVLSFTFLFFY